MLLMLEIVIHEWDQSSEKARTEGAAEDFRLSGRTGFGGQDRVQDHVRKIEHDVAGDGLAEGQSMSRLL